MSKTKNKRDKLREPEEDYEVVSFEEFCDKPSDGKKDLLTLNDNINYRIYYESLKAPNDASCSEDINDRAVGVDKETSLDGSKNGVYTKLPFAPFGKSTIKTRAPLFSGIIPKSRSDENTSSEPRYERFSQRRTSVQRFWEQVKSLCPGMLGLGVVCLLCVAVWLVVSGALGGAWTEDRYRKLWQRAHPEVTEKPMTYYEMVVPEVHYHDHNNLSTKNKFNGSEGDKKISVMLSDDKYARQMRPKPVDSTDEPSPAKYLERTPEVLQDMCTKVKDNMRFDCFPQAGANEEGCLKRRCCWKPTSEQGAPYCFYPPQYDSYTFVNMTESNRGITAYYALNRPSGYPGDFKLVRLDVTFVMEYIVSIKITDPLHRRFEPLQPEIPILTNSSGRRIYKVVVESGSVGFKIIRTYNNAVVFDSQNVGGLILSDKFLQMSAILPTNQIYGLGERRAKFRTELKSWETFTLFNMDQYPVENINLYGTQPYFMALEPTGEAFGTLLINTNAMDIVLQPTPAITYRATGGILKFFLFLGPKPMNVAQQYSQVIGRPFLPPYWSLGFHLCKYNYGSLTVTRDVWKSNREAGIPLDVQWNDLDYMEDGKDFTYDKDKFKGLPDFVNELHSLGLHYVVLFDPGLSAAEKPGTYYPFDRGLEMNIFIKNSTEQPFVGKVWNRVSTVWPDFTHRNASRYWSEMMTNFHAEIPYDGAWIDMNEPSNFVSGSLYGECAPEDLPYSPRYMHTEGLRHKTLCMDARHAAGPHYNLHNLHGFLEAINTFYALMEIRSKRPFIISRATFPGIGRFAGHWSGDVASDWHDLRMSIPEILNFNLFNIPMMGADICGFRGNTTVELCKRWMQVGAFYPFSRNHNSDSSIPQDPVSLGREVVDAARKALRTRYTLLPYYYTQFWGAHIQGDPVARPLVFHFPRDPQTFDIDTQFLIGSYLLISPILTQGATTVKAYFPGIQPWYNFEGGKVIPGGWRNITENEMVAVRGGSVIVLQEPPTGVVSTSLCRSRAMQLLVAPDAQSTAHGFVYWDDGDGLRTHDEMKYSIVHFALQKRELQINVEWWGYGMPIVNKITVLAQKKPIKMVYVDDLPCKKPLCEFTFSSQYENLTLFNTNIKMDKKLAIRWEVETTSP